MAASSDGPVILVVSDAIGETAELVARACASQFSPGALEIRRYPYVSGEADLAAVVEAARGTRAVIFHTLILPELRAWLTRAAAEAGVPAVDIMGPAMEALSRVLDEPPALEPGRVHRLDEDYFRRIEAVEFAVKYDDGRGDPRGLFAADIVLVGVSRTSKTPVSLYLAQRRHLRVANVPLVPEVEPPRELFGLPHGKVIGLTIAPDKLLTIRRERLRTIGMAGDANYADLDRILQELEHADRVFRRIGCPVIDVSDKAVEETANTVLERCRVPGAAMD